MKYVNMKPPMIDNRSGNRNMVKYNELKELVCKHKKNAKKMERNPEIMAQIEALCPTPNPKKPSKPKPAPIKDVNEVPTDAQVSEFQKETNKWQFPFINAAMGLVGAVGKQVVDTMKAVGK